MRTVFLFRHAKSSWSDPTLADIDRPLAPRGERAAKNIARYVRRKRIRPTLVLCSPSVRTRRTLEAIEPSLIMLIGHNPGLQELALALATGGADLPRLEEKLPTGALATLVADCESWKALRPGDAKLVDYVVPRDLD